MIATIFRLVWAEVKGSWFIPALLFSFSLLVLATHAPLFLPGRHAEMSHVPNSMLMVIFVACALSGHVFAPWFMRAGLSKEETLAFLLTSLWRAVWS